MNQHKKSELLYSLSKDLKGIVRLWVDKEYYSNNTKEQAEKYLNAGYKVLLEKYQQVLDTNSPQTRINLAYTLDRVMNKSLFIVQKIDNLNGKPLPAGSFTIINTNSTVQKMLFFDQCTELPIKEVINMVRRFAVAK